MLASTSTRSKYSQSKSGGFPDHVAGVRSDLQFTGWASEPTERLPSEEVRLSTTDMFVRDAGNNIRKVEFQ
jgi:hypothetical protein